MPFLGPGKPVQYMSSWENGKPKTTTLSSQHHNSFIVSSNWLNAQSNNAKKNMFSCWNMVSPSRNFGFSLQPSDQRWQKAIEDLHIISPWIWDPLCDNLGGKPTTVSTISRCHWVWLHRVSMSGMFFLSRPTVSFFGGNVASMPLWLPLQGVKMPRWW